MSLISTRDFWASVPPFLHLSLAIINSLLWVATRGRERIKYCFSSFGSDYKACTNHVLLDSMYIIMYHITVIRPLILLMVPQIAFM